MGIGGVGKSTFTINLANSFKNKKILIVEINSKMSDIKYLLNIVNKKVINNTYNDISIDMANEKIINNNDEILNNGINNITYSINKNIDIITD